MFVLGIRPPADGEALVERDYPLGRGAAEGHIPGRRRRPQAALELLLAVVVLQPGRGQVTFRAQHEVALVAVLLLPQVAAFPHVVSRGGGGHAGCRGRGGSPPRGCGRARPPHGCCARAAGGQGRLFFLDQAEGAAGGPPEQEQELGRGLGGGALGRLRVLLGRHSQPARRGPVSGVQRRESRFPARADRPARHLQGPRAGARRESRPHKARGSQARLDIGGREGPAEPPLGRQAAGRAASGRRTERASAHPPTRSRSERAGLSCSLSLSLSHSHRQAGSRGGTTAKTSRDSARAGGEEPVEAGLSRREEAGPCVESKV